MSSSSTFNFDRRAWMLLVGGLAILWGLDFVLAGPVASWLAETYADPLMQATKNRVSDIDAFVQRRAFEACILVTSAAFGVAVFLSLVGPLAKIGKQPWTCIPLALCGFVLLNGWLLVAEQTGLFWMVLYRGGPDLRVPLIESELTAMRESKRPTKVVILGSSQANAQIDVGLLNKLFTPSVHFANLSYYGAEPNDMLMLQTQLVPPPDIAICYLSELSFFRGLSSDRLVPLQNRQSRKDFELLGGQELIPAKQQWLAEVARWVPLFRMRRAVESFVFGQVGPPPISSAQDRSFEARLEMLSSGIRTDDGSSYQRRAMQLFVERAGTSGTALILIAGTVHPAVGEKLGPDYRQDMLLFLRRLAERPHVTLLEQELFTPTAEDYRDLSHLKSERRPAYTRQLAKVLAQQLGWNYRD